ncbi:MAG: hypothetical protein ABGZ35_03550 [Planctomycetaceae bacterium]
MMTSPKRKRWNQSRRRRLAQQQSTPETDTRATLEPIKRSDCVLYRQAVRGQWDVPQPKRRQMVSQLMTALNSSNDRLAMSAARTLIVMVEQDGVPE